MSNEITGEPLTISGRVFGQPGAGPSGDVAHRLGAIPAKDNQMETMGIVVEQSRTIMNAVARTTTSAGRLRDDVARTVAGLKERADLPGFDPVRGAFLPRDLPAGSEPVNGCQANSRAEVEIGTCSARGPA